MQEFGEGAHEGVVRGDAEGQFDGHHGVHFPCDFKAVLLDKAAGGGASVEAKVGAIEDPAFGVFETSEQEAEADGDVRDVRDGDEDASLRGEEITAGGEDAFGVGEVFEDIQEEDAVEWSGDVGCGKVETLE